MKILLGNNTLSILAGSERWTETLALQLKKMGHDVTAFSPELGVISENLQNAGISCINEASPSGIKPFSILLEEKKDLSFDLIIANHNHIVRYLRYQFPKVPIISPVHGIIHKMTLEDGREVDAPEHPATDANVDQFIAVSEEVQQVLKKDYDLDSFLLRNFFDLQHFDAKRPINPDKPATILVNTNYFGSHDHEIEIIREVAKHYGARLAATGINFAVSKDMMQGIEDADIVVGMGRSVLEGVGAGRLGIVHGRWGTGGVVHEGSIEQLRRFNFSGRNSGGKLSTAAELITEIDEYYNDKTVAWGKQYMRSQHNVVFAAETLIQLGRGFIERNQKPPVVSDRRPYRLAKDV